MYLLGAQLLPAIFLPPSRPARSVASRVNKKRKFVADGVLFAEVRYPVWPQMTPLEERADGAARGPLPFAGLRAWLDGRPLPGAR